MACMWHTSAVYGSKFNFGSAVNW